MKCKFVPLFLLLIILSCDNKKVRFLPPFEVKNDYIYQPDREITEELTKLKEIHVFYIPDIVGNPNHFDFEHYKSKGIQAFYLGSTFEKPYKEPFSFVTEKMTKLSYKDSYIFVGLPIEAGISKQYSYIITGIVRNNDILLQNNIHIGMDKKTALNHLFANSFVSSYQPQLSFADTLQIDDNWGFIQHKIIFHNGKLNSINMEFLLYKEWEEFIQ
ncbi:MAG: hypothetical protein R2771_06585 [Saprospiraceae bacterium]